MELTIGQALQQGVAAHKGGKLEEAERLYRAILGSNPGHPDANHNLGVLAVSLNKVGDALPLFKAALEANPKVEQFWLSYIDALIRGQQYDAGRQVIAEGRTHGIGGDKLSALEAQLTQAADGRAPSQAQLGSLFEYYQSGRYGDAEELALSLTEEFAEHPFAWKTLGAVLKQSGRQSEAV